MRSIARFHSGLVGLLLWSGFGVALAQPLVTDDLSVYYSFDSFGEVIPDESGIDPPLDGDIYGIVAQDDSDAVRGESSAFIFSEPLDGGPFVAEHFIAIGGCDSMENIEACEALPPDRIPSTGYTIATWARLQDTGGDQSLHQVRSGDGSFVVHAQAQADRQLRLHLRGQLQADNIVAFRGGEWIEDEWFHFVATYDQPSNEWAMYFNGQGVAAGNADENAGNIELGDWGQGSLIGVTPDRGRQAYGNFDEYYIFTRAITPDEVQILYNLEEPVGTLNCDFDANSRCDIADIDSLGAAIIAGTNDGSFDLNNDGNVNATDLSVWRELAGTENGWAEPYLDGDANLDGVVNAGDLNAVGSNWLATSTTNPWSMGDFNASGTTDVTDLNALALNWQKQIATAAAPAEASTVPEPDALALVLMAVVATSLASRRR